MKKAPSIDTLRYAQRLADTGMDRKAANAMAQALNEELEDRLLTKADIRQALQPIHVKLAEFDQRFASIDAKFEAMDAKFEAKIDSLSTKLTFGISTVLLVMSLLVAMGAFQIARSAPPAAPTAVAVKRPAEPLPDANRRIGSAQTSGLRAAVPA